MNIRIQGYTKTGYRSIELKIDTPLTEEVLDSIVKNNDFILGTSHTYDIVIPITVITDDFVYKKYSSHWTEAARLVVLPVVKKIEYTTDDIANNIKQNNETRERCNKASIADGKYIIAEVK